MSWLIENVSSAINSVNLFQQECIKMDSANRQKYLEQEKEKQQQSNNNNNADVKQNEKSEENSNNNEQEEEDDENSLFSFVVPPSESDNDDDDTDDEQQNLASASATSRKTKKHNNKKKKKESNNSFEAIFSSLPENLQKLYEIQNSSSSSYKNNDDESDKNVLDDDNDEQQLVESLFSSTRSTLSTLLFYSSKNENSPIEAEFECEKIDFVENNNSSSCSSSSSSCCRKKEKKHLRLQSLHMPLGTGVSTVVVKGNFVTSEEEGERNDNDKNMFAVRCFMLPSSSLKVTAKTSDVLKKYLADVISSVCFGSLISDRIFNNNNSNQKEEISHQTNRHHGVLKSTGVFIGRSVIHSNFNNVHQFDTIPNIFWLFSCWELASPEIGGTWHNYLNTINHNNNENNNGNNDDNNNSNKANKKIQEILKQFLNLIEAVEELHDNFIIHRDIKSGNAFVIIENDNNKNIVLGDLDTCLLVVNDNMHDERNNNKEEEILTSEIIASKLLLKVSDDDENNNNNSNHKNNNLVVEPKPVGTIWYSAPELIFDPLLKHCCCSSVREAKHHFDFKSASSVDVFSLGATLLRVVTGKHMYSSWSEDACSIGDPSVVNLQLTEILKKVGEKIIVEIYSTTSTFFVENNDHGENQHQQEEDDDDDFHLFDKNYIENCASSTSSLSKEIFDETFIRTVILPCLRMNPRKRCAVKDLKEKVLSLISKV